MSAAENRAMLARFGMTDAELDAWFAVTDVAARIGGMTGWASAEAHDMVHAVHVVQSLLLARPVMRAAAPDEPDAPQGAPVPGGAGALASRTPLERVGLTAEEIDVCLAVADVAAQLQALPGLPRYSWHGCAHALRHLQDLVIGHAVARASGLPRPPVTVDAGWEPDTDWLVQSRPSLLKAGMTEEEIEACAAIGRAARHVHTLPDLHETAWHDSMHAFRVAEETVLARPGMRAQGWPG